MASIEPVDRFLDQNGARFVEELKEFLALNYSIAIEVDYIEKYLKVLCSQAPQTFNILFKSFYHLVVRHWLPILNRYVEVFERL